MPFDLDPSTLSIVQDLKEVVDIKRADQDPDDDFKEIRVDVALAQEIMIVPNITPNEPIEDGQFRSESEYSGIMLTPNDAIQKGDIVERVGKPDLFVTDNPRIANVQRLELDSKVI